MVSLLHKALEGTSSYLTQFAARVPSNREIELLTVDGHGRYPSQPLVYAKVQAFVHELEVRFAWSVEGLMRVSAPTHAVRALWAFASSDDFTLVRVDNIHVIMSALKLYLREQQPLLLPASMYTQIIGCMRVGSVTEKRSGLAYVVSLLDGLRRLVLYDVCVMGNKILGLSSLNKMTADNVSICLSPSVIEPDMSDPMKIAETAPLAKQAFLLLLSDVQAVFDPKQLTRDRQDYAEGTECEAALKVANALSMQATEGGLGETLSVQEMAQLMATAEIVSVGSGTLDSGAVLDAAEALWWVESGQCRITRGGRTVLELRAGDCWFSANHGGTLEAGSTRARLWRLPGEALQTALLLQPALGPPLFARLASDALRALARLHMARNQERGAADNLADRTSGPLTAPSRISEAPGESIVSPPVSGRRAATASARLSMRLPRHSSTSSYGLRLYSARHNRVKGSLAVTATHLAFEKATQDQALFVPFPSLERAGRSGSNLSLHLSSGVVESFDLESEDAAVELQNALLRLLAARHEKTFAKTLDQKNEDRLALCIVSSKEGSLGLRESDVVALIKDEEDSPLWYGERSVKTDGEGDKVEEGYFEASSVVRLPLAPPPFPWELTDKDGRLVRLHRGQRMPLAAGFVYILVDGVLARDGGEKEYWNAAATLGLGAVLGVTKLSPDPEAVLCFSDVAHLRQLDLRPGGFLAARLDPLKTRLLLEWMSSGLWKRLEQAWDDETLQLRIVRTRLEMSTNLAARRFESGMEMAEVRPPEASKPRQRHRSKAGSRRKSHHAALKMTNEGSTVPRLNVAQQSSSLKPDLFNMLTAVRGDQEDE